MELLYELFRIDERTGLRVHRFALIGLPRKSGKTEFAAAISLYLTDPAGDGETRAQTYCAAAAEDQADASFSAAKAMVEFDRRCNRAPVPADHVDEGLGPPPPYHYTTSRDNECPIHLSKDCLEPAPLNRRFTIYESRSSNRIISSVDPHAYIERLSSKGKTKHGLNVHAVILDELHAWSTGEGDELYAALTTGGGARLQPLAIAITTAGDDLERSRCGQLYTLGRRIERGEQEAEGFLFRWYGAPDYECPECGRHVHWDGEPNPYCIDHPGIPLRRTPVDDPAMWALSSPSFGRIVSEDFYRLELSTKTEAEVRRLYLNQWVAAGEIPWLPPGTFEALKLSEPVVLVANSPTFTGVDISTSLDATAVAIRQTWDGPDRPCGVHNASHPPCAYYRVRIWERPGESIGKPATVWEVDEQEVLRFILAANAENRVHNNVFDPWGSKGIQQQLAKLDRPVEDIWATGAKRAQATVTLTKDIKAGLVHWDDQSPGLARHVANSSTEPMSGAGEGYYLVKSRRGARIDGAMAMVHAEYGAIFTTKVPAGPSVYESRGIRTL